LDNKRAVENIRRITGGAESESIRIWAAPKSNPAEGQLDYPTNSEQLRGAGQRSFGMTQPGEEMTSGC